MSAPELSPGCRSCESCRHFLDQGVNGSTRAPWELVRTDDVGLCRRRPPVWVGKEMDEDGEDGLWSFPAIHKYHVCGEWSI